MLAQPLAISQLIIVKSIWEMTAMSVKKRKKCLVGSGPEQGKMRQKDLILIRKGNFIYNMGVRRQGVARS